MRPMKYVIEKAGTLRPFTASFSVFFLMCMPCPMFACCFHTVYLQACQKLSFSAQPFFLFILAQPF